MYLQLTNTLQPSKNVMSVLHPYVQHTYTSQLNCRRVFLKYVCISKQKKLYKKLLIQYNNFFENNKHSKKNF